MSKKITKRQIILILLCYLSIGLGIYFNSFAPVLIFFLGAESYFTLKPSNKRNDKF
jgi:hypothetical protein